MSKYTILTMTKGSSPNDPTNGFLERAHFSEAFDLSYSSELPLARVILGDDRISKMKFFMKSICLKTCNDPSKLTSICSTHVLELNGILETSNSHIHRNQHN